MAWLLVALILAAAPAWAGQLDASWTPPTTNTDGSPVSGPLTYRVYWVLFPQTPCPGTQFLVSNPGATSLHLASVTAGMTYNAQVTAVNAAGNQSVDQACIALAIPAKPTAILKPGTNLKLNFGR